MTSYPRIRNSIVDLDGKSWNREAFYSFPLKLFCHRNFAMIGERNYLSGKVGSDKQVWNCEGIKLL